MFAFAIDTLGEIKIQWLTLTKLKCQEAYWAYYNYSFIGPTFLYTTITGKQELTDNRPESYFFGGSYNM